MMAGPDVCKELCHSAFRDSGEHECSCILIKICRSYHLMVIKNRLSRHRSVRKADRTNGIHIQPDCWKCRCLPSALLQQKIRSVNNTVGSGAGTEP